MNSHIIRSISQAIISVLSELVTPEVLQPTPLKKNLVLRFEARTKRGETRLHFVDPGLHERLHDFEYQTTQGFRDTWLRAN